MTANTETEVESTFLARQVPREIAGVQPQHMYDMYLPSDDPILVNMRIRHRGDRHEITKKMPLKITN